MGAFSLVANLRSLSPSPRSNDSTDDPALQYLVNSEKEHHEAVVGNLIDVIKEYVPKFHDLLLLEPTPIVMPVDSGVYNETVVVSTTESTPEKNESKDSGKASDSEKVEEEEDEDVDTKDERGDVGEEEGEAGSKAEHSSEDANSSSSSVEAETPERDSPLTTTAVVAEGEEENDKKSVADGESKGSVPAGVSTRRNNNFTRSHAFGNTRLQICCLVTVLLETENRDIINA